jgi:hypothetical protein
MDVSPKSPAADDLVKDIFVTTKVTKVTMNDISVTSKGKVKMTFLKILLVESNLTALGAATAEDNDGSVALHAKYVSWVYSVQKETKVLTRVSRSPLKIPLSQTRAVRMLPQLPRSFLF